MRSLRTALLIGVVTVALGAAAMTGRAADRKDVEWRAYSGDKASSKYSSLDQINKDTIKNLRIAWRQSGMPMELRSQFPNVQAPTNYENTPLMIGGLVYMSTALGTIAALDAATGTVVWFDTPSQRSSPTVEAPPSVGRAGAPPGGVRRRAAWRTGRTAATSGLSPPRVSI
jgi:quinoprotein glucose dehydrogenase